MRRSEQIIIAGLLLISYFAFVYTFVGSAMDWKCNVSVNYTLLNTKWKYNTCYNETFLNTKRERNLTRHEQWNCFSKCIQITDGVAIEDGSISPKLSETIENMYKKYTNATSSYIKKVYSIHAGCAKDANSKIKFLQKNGTAIGECELNGLYDNCYSSTMGKLLKNHWDKNETMEELNPICGDQLGMKV